MPTPAPASGMSQGTLEQNLRLLRTVHAALVVSIVLYVFVALKAARTPKAVAPAFVIAIGMTALSATGIAFVLRSRLVDAAEQILVRDPGDQVTLRRWRAGHIVSFALAESVALYGLVLRFVGAEWRLAGVFFAGGALLMLLFTPRHP